MAIEPQLTTAPSLAEQALANLVNQFARPLDFLRELAQNSIDAGSPRIDVSVAFTPPGPGETQGVLRIQVDDYGEGMNEDVIDNQLTRLFSSSKEHDLTKIGKFGIGFTSIFAIRPEAVLLRTGKQGEYWELLFHRDRTFDKVRIDEPVHGTKVTLFKRMLPSEIEGFVREVRFVLSYWCEHSETPITFADRTASDQPQAPQSDDPFAAFAEPARPGEASVQGVERIDRALTLDLPLEVRHEEPGLEVVIGFADPPRYGFYNGGLTLLNTQNTDVLGEYKVQLSHLTFKVKYDRLEHTLTRDNVLHDENWRHAMDGVVRAQAVLRRRLLDEIVAACTSGAPLGPWQRRLAADVKAADGGPYRPLLRDLPLFRDVYGRPVTLGAVRAQEAKLGCVMVGGAPTPLYDALAELGYTVLEDKPDARTLLLATDEPVLFDFMRRTTSIRKAEELWIVPALVDRPGPGEKGLEPAEARLVSRTEELLGSAVGLRVRVPGTDRVIRWKPDPDGVLNRLTIRVGDFGGTDLAQSEVLALNGPPDGRAFLRPEPAEFQIPAILNWRCLLVNRHHPLFRAQVLASAEDLDVAAFGLATALLFVEGIEGEGAYRRMLSEVMEAPPLLPLTAPIVATQGPPRAGLPSTRGGSR